MGSGRCNRPPRFADLPDYYVTVAEDVLRFCEPREGLWVDLGSGSGPVGLALARRSKAVVILVDPKQEVLAEALEEVGSVGLQGRVLAVAGEAERLPLATGSLQLVVSRGSIYFWRDPVEGLREVYRVLAPGGRAMVGGGLGSKYPEGARAEFMRRRREDVARRGGDALGDFQESRSPERFARLAEEAGVPGARVIPDALGCWLLFGKAVCG